MFGQVLYVEYTNRCIMLSILQLPQSMLYSTGWFSVCSAAVLTA